jgi:ubiquinone/menaquinone biosynthesis C-methylase UbiE
VIFYDGNKFPIDDQEFDYVICSHVIEHIQDVNQFLSEMFRVASNGYIEYPTIFYEYLYNFKMHLNFIKFNGKTLMYCRKEKTNLSQFLPVQSQFLHTFEMNYTCLVNQLQEFMFEGFEWETIFDFKETLYINDMVWRNLIYQNTFLRKRICYSGY